MNTHITQWNIYIFLKHIKTQICRVQIKAIHIYIYMHLRNIPHDNDLITLDG